MSNNDPVISSELASAFGDRIIEYLADISCLDSVTGCEFRLFRWVKKWKAHLSHELKMEYIAGSQLLLTWQGAPEVDDRLTIIAHSDHEGYLIRSAELTGDGKTSLVGVPVGSALEGADRVNTHTRLFFEENGKTRQVDAFIEQVDSSGNAEILASVELPGLCQEPTRCHAVAQHWFEGRYRVRREHLSCCPGVLY